MIDLAIVGLILWAIAAVWGKKAAAGVVLVGVGVVGILLVVAVLYCLAHTIR